MNTFRFLHAADLHLDSPFRGMTNLPAAIRETVKQSTFNALHNVVDIAIREKVQFVVISGDVYDLADRSLRAQLRFQKATEMLADRGIAVFLIHGNHDPEDGRRASLSWPDTVHLFPSDEAAVYPVTDINGKTLAHVYGISYPTSAVTDNFAMRFRVRDSSVFNIGLLHTNVDGDPSHDNYAPCSKADLLRSGIDYWALGHIHTRQVIHEQPFIVYPGNVQGRSIKETGPKGCYVVDVTDIGSVHLTFHETDCLRWTKETVAIDGLTTVQHLKEQLEQSMTMIQSASGGRPSIVRFTCRGRGPVHQMLNQGTYLHELVSEIRAEQSERAASDVNYPFVWMESLRMQTGAHVSLEQLEDHPVLGDLLHIVQRLFDHDREFAEFTSEALSPLLAHNKAKKYIADLTLEDQKEWLLAAQQLAVDALLDDSGWED